MAKETANLGVLDAATTWMYLPSGPVDLSLESGLTGTVVLEKRTSGGTAQQVYDKDGTAYSWTGPFDTVFECGGSLDREYRLRCSAYTSGDGDAFMGHK